MKATTLTLLRRLHLYAAILFAPAIIFFAFSGILQTFGFHEARGGHGQPPAWIKAIASLHQHQQLHRPERPKAAGPGVAATEHDRPGGGDHDGAPRPEAPATAALKLFTGLTGLGLVIASLLGIAVALGTRSTRRVSTVMLAVGLILPAALIVV